VDCDKQTKTRHRGHIIRPKYGEIYLSKGRLRIAEKNWRINNFMKQNFVERSSASQETSASDEPAS